jgi:DNA-binding transcriptional LysR family regulator
MSVSLRQLEYFVAVVDTGSFTQAAADLHVSQPGLSSQIMSLERQLGGPLLERLTRGVRLTPAGRIALPHARASLAHAERARTGALRAAGLDAGELHVGTLYSLSVGVLPDALRAWRASYPDVAVRLVEFRHTDDLIEAMQAGRADVAVGPTPPDWEGPIREIGAETFCLAGPRDAGPLTRPAIDLSELADAQWVHFTPPSGLADILDEACHAAGFSTPRSRPHRAISLRAQPRQGRTRHHPRPRQRHPRELRRIDRRTPTTRATPAQRLHPDPPRPHHRSIHRRHRRRKHWPTPALSPAPPDPAGERAGTALLRPR